MQATKYKDFSCSYLFRVCRAHYYRHYFKVVLVPLHDLRAEGIEGGSEVSSLKTFSCHYKNSVLRFNINSAY